MRNVTRKKLLYALKIILPTLYLGMLAFIFGNSLLTGEQSSQASKSVVDMLQAFFKVIAPNSKIATATGEDYLRLHEIIRVLAHFTEFALLGALAAGCYLVYNAPKKYQYWGVGSIVIVPVLDDILQYFTDGRAAQVFDVCVDICGGTMGYFLIIGLCYLVRLWINKKTIKEQNDDERK